MKKWSCDSKNRADVTVLPGFGVFRKTQKHASVGGAGKKTKNRSAIRARIFAIFASNAAVHRRTERESSLRAGSEDDPPCDEG